jgi:hypothetical protein
MSGGTATGSIRQLAPADNTTTPQIREDVLNLRARTAEVRGYAANLASQADDLHDRVQEVDLDDRATTLVQNEPSVLLSALGEELGMPWSLVAELVGVSPTAVRKWRRGGAITPDTRSRLARLVAFCQVLPELEPRITDVVLWLQSPIIAGSSTITAGELFAKGSDVALLNRATSRITAEELLDTAAPGWRSTTRPDNGHRVVEAPDGELAIVPVD